MGSSHFSQSQQYAATMNKRHRYGYGFLEPEPFKIVSPGTCGYVNGFGQWQPLPIDLEDEDDMQAKGFTTITTVIRSEPDSRLWGPKESSTVKHRSNDLTLGASGMPTGLPVDASIALTFSLKSDFGTVLLTSDPVIKEGFLRPQPFLEWARANAKTMLEKYPETKDHGFYVVTTTYSCNEIHINAWTEKEKDVVVGFSAGVTGIGEVGPSSKFFTAESSSAWNKFSGEKRVIFFNGYRFRYHKIQILRQSPFGEVSPDEWGFRGRNDVFKISDPDKPDEEYAVEMEELGDEESW